MPQNVSQTNESGPAYPNSDEYINGPATQVFKTLIVNFYFKDYYHDPFSHQQPTDSQTTYSPYRPYAQLAMKQPLLRQPLQRQVVYQQQSMQGVQMGPPSTQTPLQQIIYAQPSNPSNYALQANNNSHHVVNLYDGSVVDQRNVQPAPVPYIPPQVPSFQQQTNLNGTNQPKVRKINKLNFF